MSWLSARMTSTLSRAARALVSFRRRIWFRLVFGTLVLGTLALATVLLKEEKERVYQNYGQTFAKTHAQIIAQLRHPAGQLALINAGRQQGSSDLISPLVLPFGALDFDDQNKVQQAVEMANCSILYPKDRRLCVAIGSNPFAGGFIYLVGQFNASTLVPRERGMLELDQVHRAVVTLQSTGKTSTWIAPLEVAATESVQGAGIKGRLTGFPTAGSTLEMRALPDREFRGLLWQSPQCEDTVADNCLRRVQLSIRLPVEAFRDALFGKNKPVWPPLDLDGHTVRLQFIAPDQTVLLDSQAPGAIRPLTLPDLSGQLQAGETLSVRKLVSTKTASQLLWTFNAPEDARQTTSPWLLGLIARLPIDAPQLPKPLTDKVRTPAGQFDVTLMADGKGLEKGLAAAATRMVGYVGALLAAILLAWGLIEWGLISRIGMLTRRAVVIPLSLDHERFDQHMAELDFSDLKGEDELGVLASGLSDLLDRAKADWQQKQIRAQKDKDMWHAVGHEIMSPLQSLMALHSSAQDPSYRYIQRMQLALKVLYGQASPTEAIESANLDLAKLDLVAFMRTVTDNAPFAGIDNVVLQTQLARCEVRAEEFSLEDVITHILNNANRFRSPGTQILLVLTSSEDWAVIRISNQGPQIPTDQLQSIFEYGTSCATAATADADAEANKPAEGVTHHRGQGLFVVKTYMAKMGGLVMVENSASGVCFQLQLRTA